MTDTHKHVWSLGSPDTKKSKTAKLSIPFLCFFYFGLQMQELRPLFPAVSVCVCATGRGQRLKRPAGVSQTLRQLFGLRRYFLRVCEDGDISDMGGGQRAMRSSTDTHAARYVKGQQGGGGCRGGTGEEIEAKTRENNVLGLFKLFIFLSLQAETFSTPPVASKVRPLRSCPEGALKKSVRESP